MNTNNDPEKDSLNDKKSFDLEEGGDVLKRRTNGEDKQPRRVMFEGRMYDLDDEGRLVDNFEIDLPFINKTIKINVCDFFKYLFGKHTIIFRKKGISN